MLRPFCFMQGMVSLRYKIPPRIVHPFLFIPNIRNIVPITIALLFSRNRGFTKIHEIDFKNRYLTIAYSSHHHRRRNKKRNKERNDGARWRRISSNPPCTNYAKPTVSNYLTRSKTSRKSPPPLKRAFDPISTEQSPPRIYIYIYIAHN